jgi:transposase-like protein
VPSSAFVGFRFPPEIIVLAVRWYLRYGLSYRDVEEFLFERGIEVDHVTVFGGCSASRRSWRTRPGCAAMPSATAGLWTRRT